MIVLDLKITRGEMAEWLKAHAWKVCKEAALSWVRIPLSPPTLILKYSMDLPLQHIFFCHHHQFFQRIPKIRPLKMLLHLNHQHQHQYEHNLSYLFIIFLKKTLSK